MRAVKAMENPTLTLSLKLDENNEILASVAEKYTGEVMFIIAASVTKVAAQRMERSPQEVAQALLKYITEGEKVLGTLFRGGSNHEK